MQQPVVYDTFSVCVCVCVCVCMCAHSLCVPWNQCTPNKNQSTLEEAMAVVENQCLQFSLLSTVLLFVITIDNVSGQLTGESLRVAD